jgi:hypothetical protein
MEILLVVLAVALWGSVYWPIYLIMRMFFMSQAHYDLKASLIALFWPVTVPLGLLLLMVVGKWRF